MFRQRRRWSSVYLNIIINLPARFKNEQPIASAGQSDYGEGDKKCLHSLHLKRFQMVENDSVPTDGINCR
jgi:hypothetical protein